MSRPGNVSAAAAWLTDRDGSLPSLISLGLISAAFFGGTCYVALAVGFNYNDAFFVGTEHPEQLKSIALFALTMIWPAA